MVKSVGTQQTCFSANLSRFSLPMKKPCSMEWQPASIAICTGTIPFAWTMTFSP